MVQDDPPSQGMQIDTGHETSAEIHPTESRAMPQTVSAGHRSVARPGLEGSPSLLVPSQHAPLRLAKPRRKGGPGPFRRRRIQRQILTYCAQGPTEVSGLLRDIARGTLYRTITKVKQLGFLKQVGRGYHTTVLGQRWLLEDTSQMDWNLFDQLYPPFAHIPTFFHKALLELIVAAAVVRHAGLHADHLCSFLLMGGTLWWKTTCGHMACATLGVDPSVSLIDVA